MTETKKVPSIFTKIINRELPAEILHEDEKCIVIQDIAPQAPVHFLVIPKEQIDEMNNVNDERTISLVGYLLMIANKVAKEQNLNEGYRVVMNNWRPARLEVPHLHFHVMGGREMEWPPG